MKKYFLSAILLLVSTIMEAQVEKTSELFKALKAKDSLLFNVGFNTCDIKQFENLVSNNFEFYHDTSGITNSKASFISVFKDGVCKMSYKAIRELDETTLEVFPLMKNNVLYGAIQKGVHRFYALEENKSKYFTSIAKFSNIWLIENGVWKLSRSLSYDHKEKDSAINQALLFIDKSETERWLQQEKVPALGIGYIEDGKLKETHVYGNLKNGNKATKNTIFNVASLTKPVAAIVALKLTSLNKWNINEPVYKYFEDPDIKNDPRSKLLTTRHILSHQTGFPNWRWNTESGKLAFEFDPGTKYQYSGEGMEILQKALENKFKKSLNELAKELIFKPLKMKNTSFFWENNIQGTLFSGNYDTKGNEYNLDTYTKVSAADNLLTTVEDYGKFLISVMNSIELSKGGFDEMITQQVETKKNVYFGLGFEIYPFKDENYALSHGGSDKGVQALFFIIPNSKKGIIIFTNADDGYKVFEKLIAHYLTDYGEEIIKTATSN